MCMKTKKSDFTGTGSVYRFTLVQMLKAKANLITTVIFLLFAVAAIPVSTFIMGGEKSSISEIATVYVRNDSGYALEPAQISQENPLFAQTLFEMSELTEDTYGETIADNELFVHLFREPQTGALKVMAYAAESKTFSGEDLSACTEALRMLLDEARYAGQEATPQQIALLTGGYEVDSMRVSEYLEEPDDSEELFEAKFFVQMIYAIIMIMLSTFASAFIIQKIIEEKASKLAETLMVSVQPLALLVGKILAVMTYVFGLLALTAVGAGVSYLVTSRFADTSVIAAQMIQMGITPELLRLSPMTAVVLLISVLLGYLTVSLISGLLGSGCATTEDVEPANMAVVLLVLAGYLVSVITVAFSDSPAISVAVSLIPVSSMFCAPARYLTGDIEPAILGLSWLIQMLVIGVLAFVCAKLYRDLMVYRGTRLKLGGFIAMMRRSRKEAQ